MLLSCSGWWESRGTEWARWGFETKQRFCQQETPFQKKHIMFRTNCCDCFPRIIQNLRFSWRAFTTRTARCTSWVHPTMWWRTWCRSSGNILLRTGRSACTSWVPPTHRLLESKGNIGWSISGNFSVYSLYFIAAISAIQLSMFSPSFLLLINFWLIQFIII